MRLVTDTKRVTGGETQGGARTLLVSVERRKVAFVEIELRHIRFRARRVPLLREGERFPSEGGVVDHLHRKLEAFPIEPFL